ncbi:N,N'-diacetyllegionaminic acid synthase [Pseudoalteromonas sp. NCCP-2140]|uniref:N-acetylneuraminate synthase n=1 Tax=Pseudoalteromonas sp. NCCP-2140 TaxID=2942288 RepID=UPI00203BF1B6|nr:N-acetylneuraminate synthase [Pseudoalteromonas sp. NCCP-2140]GKW51889.1 N,N'-diacetyllegionaminic acid synthase [Pseudoalteromonas sp. NCCP-2140]
MNSVKIIAEIGVNHNGSLELAKQLIDLAVEAKVDFVKFQTFKSEAVICKNAEKAEYQKNNTGCRDSQLDMVKKLELTFEQHRELKKYAESKGSQYLSTPFDLESLRFLLDLGLKTIKIPSGEITNYFLLTEAAKHEINIILSTGMSTMDEICHAVKILKFNNKIKEITVLHCNTQYPTPYHDVNLAAMKTMADKLGCKVGYSDHTLGTEVSVAAVALGACVIEKHFTLSRLLPGPDHSASIEPCELRSMVKEIRNIEKAIGKPEKVITSSEVNNINIARKFLVASRSIIAGQEFSLEDFSAKRTGVGGISPMLVKNLVGKIAKHNYKIDDVIQHSENDSK